MPEVPDWALFLFFFMLFMAPVVIIFIIHEALRINRIIDGFVKPKKNLLHNLKVREEKIDERFFQKSLEIWPKDVAVRTTLLCRDMRRQLVEMSLENTSEEAWYEIIYFCRIIDECHKKENPLAVSFELEKTAREFLKKKDVQAL